MALKSAKIAGLKVDGASFQGCMSWLDAATDPADGKCAYSGYKTTGSGRFSRKVRPGSGREAMWAAGMLMLARDNYKSGLTTIRNRVFES